MRTAAAPTSRRRSGEDVVAAERVTAPGVTAPGLFEQIAALARRSVKRTLRQGALLIFPLLFPLILFAINGSALGAARRIPGFPPVSYRDFALAVTFMQGALFVSVTAGTDLARDIESGFLNRLALTPMRGAALIAGQLGGPVVVACVQSTCLPARRRRDWRGHRQRRRRRVRAAAAVDPDRLRLRRPGHTDRAAVREWRGGAGVLPAAVRDGVPQLVEPAAQPHPGRTGFARSRPTTRSRI